MYREEALDIYRDEDLSWKMLEIKEWYKEILKHVYETGDINGLENALDEMSFYVEVKLPESQPRMTTLKETNER